MAGNPTPRRMVKDLLQGMRPPRPLLLPMAFSLGARLENLPLRSFLTNPTKISNSLKLIRTHQAMDGVACYFDPYLEIEALGGSPHWKEEDQPPKICWATDSEKGELPEGLRSPDDAAKTPKVQVAIEVLRRLKALLPGEPVLMVGVAGPLTLAARLTQLDREESLRSADLPAGAVELAASVITQISGALVEAGADLVFVQEKILPAMNAQDSETWSSLLTPTCNVTRFYEALPVLHFADPRAFAENRNVIFGQPWDCVVCAPLDAIVCGPLRDLPLESDSALGIALSHETFSGEEPKSESFCETLRSVVSQLRPAILTTTCDVDSAEDFKRLVAVLEKATRAT